MHVYKKILSPELATDRVTYKEGVRPKPKTSFLLNAKLADETMAIKYDTPFQIGFWIHEDDDVSDGRQLEFDDCMPFQVIYGDVAIHFDFFLAGHSPKGSFLTAVAMRVVEQISLQVGLNDSGEVSFEIQIGDFATQVRVPRADIAKWFDFPAQDDE